MGAKSEGGLSKSAGSGIRTHEPLRDRVLSPAPLTWLGDPRVTPHRNLNTN